MQVAIVAPIPADASTGGFDTIAAGAAHSPERTLAVLEVTEQAVAQAIAAGRLPGCTPARRDLADPCFGRVVTTFAERAHRRPLDDRDRSELAALTAAEASQAASDAEALAATLTGILMSPRFLFRSFPAAAADGHELASRLSYFIWSSVPDDALLAQARQGRLADPRTVGAEVRRMLADPRAEGFAATFGVQWLDLQPLLDKEFDRKLFPELTKERLGAMLGETTAFVRNILRQGRPADLLTAQFGFPSRELAATYGVMVKGDGFVRTSLPPSERRGVLTQASVAAVTSEPDRTSVAARGSWIVENLPCMAAPPPPPDAVDLDASKVMGQTIRQRLEQHRANPTCRACHEVMDTLGFALEPYAPSGAYRRTEGVRAIDPSGTLPDGRPFAHAVELAERLADGPGFAACVATNLLSYGTGRVATDDDRCAAEVAARDLAAEGGTLADLVALVAGSAAFRTEGPERKEQP